MVGISEIDGFHDVKLGLLEPIGLRVEHGQTCGSGGIPGTLDRCFVGGRFGRPAVLIVEVPQGKHQSRRNILGLGIRINRIAAFFDEFERFASLKRRRDTSQLSDQAGFVRINWSTAEKAVASTAGLNPV